MNILKDKNNQNYIKDTNPYEMFECIDKKSDYELPVYENMNASQVRSSLHLLVDRGIDLINIIGDNKSISQGSPKTR